MSRLPTATALLATLALVAGCNDDPTGPGDATLTLTVTPIAITIVQATVDNVQISVQRQGSIEDVNLALTGGAEGVTGLIQNISVDGNTTTATLRITVAGDVAPGNYTFMVIAQNEDADDATQIVTVTVVPEGGGGDLQS